MAKQPSPSRDSEPMTHEPTVPKLNHLMRVRLAVETPQVVGPAPAGNRRITVISGGDFDGPRLRGRVLPGGGDWMIHRTDHCAVLDARYTLECSDGALIYLQDRGLRHGPEHTMARLAKGEPVNPRDYYFRTTAQLETASADYAWLNRIVIVGSGMRLGTEVLVDFYRVD